MIEVLKNNKVIIAIVLILVLLYYTRLESFGNDSKHRVLLSHKNGLSEGVFNVWNRKNDHKISIQANLPYAKGGVFNTFQGEYKCYLISEGYKRLLGSMIRYGDRIYRLNKTIPKTPIKYNKILITRKSELVQDEIPVLEGLI